MLRALIEKEFRLALRVRRTWYAALAMGLVVVLALLSGLSAHQARVETHRKIRRSAESSFSTQRPDHPHSIAHLGYVVSRPPSPLGFLDGGHEAAFGTWLRLDAHQTRPLVGSSTPPIVRGFGGGRFDLGIALSLLAPAVLVLLGFDLFAAERSRGTLKMLLVSGVLPGPLLFSKLAGLALRAAIAIGLPASLAIGCALFIVEDPSVPYLRVALWSAGHVLSLTAWALLVLALAALVETPRAALLVGWAFWAITSLVVPPLAGGIAQSIAAISPPGEAAIQIAMWARSAHAETEDLRHRAIRDVQKRHPGWDGRSDPSPEVIDAVMLSLGDRDQVKKMRTLSAETERERRRQERIAAVVSLLSPSGLAILLSSALAGSDLAHMEKAFRHFEEYRIRLMAWFNVWWSKNGTGGFEAYGKETKFAQFEEAPRPEDPEFSLSYSMGRALLPASLLLSLIPLALLFLWGAVCGHCVSSP